jgi:UDP-N-acetylmuramoyl-L-alanyl-D-glutamate--2,6-diaminopimelate ligase
LGQHNVSNILVALALARDALGLPLAEAAAGLSAMTPLPGRLERLSTPGSLDVYVDAAHTPESVSAALATLAALAHGRRRAVVVGCGGGSDRGKRPHMARLAAASADHCILTSDNPRHEDPAAITAQMLAGVRAHDRARVRVLLDRRAAIEAALAWAWPDGIVALLGKGAETVQEVGGRREPHDDRQAALEWLRRREAGGGSGPGP